MNTRLTRQMRRRIGRLEMQSYFMLAAVVLIIAYGFVVSSRSTETTAADLQEVRQSESRVKNLADLETARYRLIDATIKLDTAFNNAQKTFDAAIADNLKKLASNLQVTSYLFWTDFKERILTLDGLRQSSDTIVVPLQLPDACENVAHLSLQRSPDQYFFFSANDTIYDYHKYVHKLSYVSITWKPPVDYVHPKSKKDRGCPGRC